MAEFKFDGLTCSPISVPARRALFQFQATAKSGMTSGIAAREVTEAAPHAQPGIKFNNHSTRVRNDFGVQPGRRRRINRRTSDERHDAGLLLPGG